MENFRILAKGEMVSNNIGANSLNNNDVIIGPSGAGKTRGYIKPNILQCNDSMIIADTKGDLHLEMRPILEAKGYKVMSVNFSNLENSYAYNPFDFIGLNNNRDGYSEQDILTISDTLCPSELTNDPFWENAAKMYLNCFIAYTLEALPKKDHHLGTVAELIATLKSRDSDGEYEKPEYITKDELGKFDVDRIYPENVEFVAEKVATDILNFDDLINEHQKEHPDSYAVRLYHMFKKNDVSSRMNQSIIGILYERFNGLVLTEMIRMYKAEKRISFNSLASEKTIVFLTISDTDRSMDRLISLFYTQAIQTLCKIADNSVGSRLKIPVRFMFDDFATNCVIQNFDNIISIIRSRHIYFSIILQSLTQLDSIYGKDKSTTIINNCDTLLYLGGQDMNTIDYIAKKVNLTFNHVSEMPVAEAILFRRGIKGKKVQRYDVSMHELYQELLDSQKDVATIKSVVEDEHKLSNKKLSLKELALKVKMIAHVHAKFGEESLLKEKEKEEYEKKIRRCLALNENGEQLKKLVRVAGQYDEDGNQKTQEISYFREDSELGDISVVKAVKNLNELTAKIDNCSNANKTIIEEKIEMVNGLFEEVKNESAYEYEREKASMPDFCEFFGGCSDDQDDLPF